MSQVYLGLFPVLGDSARIFRREARPAAFSTTCAITVAVGGSAVNVGISDSGCVGSVHEVISASRDPRHRKLSNCSLFFIRKRV